MALLYTLGALALLVAVALAFRTSRRLLAALAVAVKWAAIWIGQLLGLRRLAAALRGRGYERLTRPRMLRLIFEDLGPTYIKLGQIIASSPGLFTDPYVTEFRRCLDRVRPFPSAEARRILGAELGERAAGLAVEEQPLASASIAQVHAARTSDGREIVVKVQRPGIERRIASDVRIMSLWARLVSRLSSTIRMANPVGIIEDFGKTIREELDFVREGKNNDEFNRIMAELGHQLICAPRVEWELTSRRVLAMERFYGHNVDDVDRIRESIAAGGVDPEAKLLEGMRAWFQCVMFYGLFHGDVHAGNLMWLDDGRIGFLDFGIVGRFDELQRKAVTRYVMAFATGQFRQLAEVMVEMGSSTAKQLDVDALAADVERAYAPVRQMSFGQMKYIDLLPNILRMARNHQLRLPREFVLIIKQVLYFDRYAKLLAPNLNVFTDPRVFMALAQDVQKALAGGGVGARAAAQPAS
jgi:predicted unusual protein kinase regulating ubiquinone biosynthesis (AarF/ABC1/UbiB family)